MISRAVKPMKGQRRKTDKRRRQGPTDAAEEHGAPQDPKQHGLSLDGWHEVEHRETKAEPNAAEESEVAVEQRRPRQIKRSVKRVVDAGHRNDACGDWNQTEDGRRHLKKSSAHASLRVALGAAMHP